jgi:hypothetical protein
MLPFFSNVSPKASPPCLQTHSNQPPCLQTHRNLTTHKWSKNLKSSIVQPHAANVKRNFRLCLPSYVWGGQSHSPDGIVVHQGTCKGWGTLIAYTVNHDARSA